MRNQRSCVVWLELCIHTAEQSYTARKQGDIAKAEALAEKAGEYYLEFGIIVGAEVAGALVGPAVEGFVKGRGAGSGAVEGKAKLLNQFNSSESLIGVNEVITKP